MKYIIGFLIIVPAIHAFFKYKPKNKNVLGMFLVNMLFGIMTMVSTMSFDTLTTALLSVAAIFGLIVMNFCFYAELAHELRERKKKRKAAKIKNNSTMRHTNKPSKTENIPFVA